MGKKSQALIGKKFGLLTPVRMVEPRRRPNGCLSQMFECKCDCGNTTIVSYSHLKYGGTLSCGCLKHRSKYEDLTGQKFGRLTVLKHKGRVQIGTQDQYSQLWECICDCGTHCDVDSRSLKSGNTTSCGCVQGEKLRASHLNAYDLSGDYGVGYFSDGTTFLFDLADYPEICGYTWHKNDSGYALTTYKGKHYRMHRIILNLGEYSLDSVVDHINHNKCDNRKENLRVCTQQENCFNKLDPSNNTSGHIGVGYSVAKGKYRAYIQRDKKFYDLGCYDTYEEAVAARESAEPKYFAEFAIRREERVNGRTVEFTSEIGQDTCNFRCSEEEQEGI